MPKRTTDYRSALLEDLKDSTEAAHYLNAALEDSPGAFLSALRDVAEANQMSRVAEGAGVSRESIYRMLKESGNPTYSSFIGILSACGLEFSVRVPAADNPEAPKKDPIPSTQHSAENGGRTATQRSPSGSLFSAISPLTSLVQEVPVAPDRKPALASTQLYGGMAGLISGALGERSSSVAIRR